jgi:predicted PurR-regulated permease PerM
MFKKLKKYFTADTIGKILAVCFGVVFYLFFSNLNSVKSRWSNASKVVSPFAHAVALSYLLNKPVMRLQKRIESNVKRARAVSIAVVYLLAVVCLCAIMTNILPQIGRSLSAVAEALPEFADKTSKGLVGFLKEYNFAPDVVEYSDKIIQKAMTALSQFALSILPGILNFTIALGSGTVKLFTAVIASIYMLSGKEKLLFQLKKGIWAIFPNKAAENILSFCHMSNVIFSDFIFGKLIDSLIIGAICFVGMLIICPQYSILIAVIVGVTNMIPFFGPFFGAIPSILILLITEPILAFWFAIFILVLQQVDGNIIGPKILGGSLGLSPLWILVSIVLGNGLFGMIGMIIGVPVFAIFYNLISGFVSKRLTAKNIVADSESYTIEKTKKEDENVI